MSTHNYAWGTNEGDPPPQVQLLSEEWFQKHGDLLQTAAFQALDKDEACKAFAMMFGTFLMSVHKIDLTAEGMKIE